MLTVIKRTGLEEPYNQNKITNSIAAVAEELGQPLNTSDIASIASEMEQLIAEKTKITSRQLYMILIGILITCGFTDIANSYIKHISNPWN